MLIVKIHNDGTGSSKVANYDVEVLVTVAPQKLKTIAAGRVENHTRHDGWRKLLHRATDEVDEPGRAGTRPLGTIGRSF